MCTTYDREEHVTMYVLDVFLQATPRGLPTTSSSRVRDLVKSGMFPSRFPSRGRVAMAMGLHNYVVRLREERLETFVNMLLRAAKDISYRSGCTPCSRFEAVSKLLSDFLTEPHLRTAGSAW
ncbi:Hypothetical protein PHPALM_2613 [Phytophthora palmivora]|uniref:Uncharacterized protein n=1 Tax=Phytophthora palmivora TaxID=4796 RepID=A0A2P4YPH6_9STRA|nr:Hypothetical protein PHPALM_2613 [Phytophthora palmivora]